MTIWRSPTTETRHLGNIVVIRMDSPSMYLETTLCWNFTLTQVFQTPDTCYRSLLFVSTVVVRLSDRGIRLWSHFVPEHGARIPGTNVSTPFFQVNWPRPGTSSQPCTLVRTWYCLGPVTQPSSISCQCPGTSLRAPCVNTALDNSAGTS